MKCCSLCAETCPNHHKVDNWQEKVLSYTVPKVYTLQKDIEKLIYNQADKILKGSQAQFYEAISDSDENNSEHIESYDEKTLLALIPQQQVDQNACKMQNQNQNLRI